MGKLTDDMLRDWIQAVKSDGTNWGMAIECMANELLELRAERDQLLSDIREVFSDDWCLLNELKNLSRCDMLPPSAAAHRLLAISGEQK